MPPMSSLALTNGKHGPHLRSMRSIVGTCGPPARIAFGTTRCSPSKPERADHCARATGDVAGRSQSFRVTGPLHSSADKASSSGGHGDRARIGALEQPPSPLGSALRAMRGIADADDRPCPARRRSRRSMFRRRAHMMRRLPPGRASHRRGWQCLTCSPRRRARRAASRR